MKLNSQSIMQSGAPSGPVHFMSAATAGNLVKSVCLDRDSDVEPSLPRWFQFGKGSQLLYQAWSF